MQCGTPVITSNTSSLPEVVGDAGIMVDPHDRDALSAAMLALCRDATLRESVRQKCLTRAARFSWERTMACTISAYRAALDARPLSACVGRRHERRAASKVRRHLRCQAMRRAS